MNVEETTVVLIIEIVGNTRLCGIGVALSIETEIGKFCSDGICQGEQKHVKKSCSRWETNPQL